MTTVVVTVLVARCGVQVDEDLEAVGLCPHRCLLQKIVLVEHDEWLVALHLERPVGD